jgi:hypothetical protein
MKKILFLILIGSFFVGGCVRTYIRSSINPDFQGNSYANIIVVANLSDIESQQTVEDAVVERLSDLDVNATPSYKVFFQGNTYSKDQRRAKIRKKGFDAVLFIHFTSSYETQTYVPQTTSTTGQVNKTYNGFDYSENTYQTGGYYLSQPNFTIRTRLLESNKFDTVWVSDAQSHGCAICGFGRIMGSFADTLVNKLAKDGMLGTDEKTPEK